MAIDNIFIEIPEAIRSDIFWVGQEYRTNPLSHRPGGSDIVIVYQDGDVFGYNKIKFPRAYVQKILSKSKCKPETIYARYYQDFQQFNQNSFSKTRDSHCSYQPWESLAKSATSVN